MGSERVRRVMGRGVQWVGALALAGMVLAAGMLFFMGRWLVVSDPPEKADAIVLLGGGFTRPPHGADLYLAGWAPLVLVSRPVSFEGADLLRESGVAFPTQEEIYVALLRRKGVPEEAIGFFGNGSVSTVEEARVLRTQLGFAPRTLILVTSPHHSRRARMVFAREFPESRILVSPTPYERFAPRWWTDQSSAQKVVLETAKTVFYLLGGAFTSAN